jgi:transcriptional regulator with XRE-family HTH domain
MNRLAYWFQQNPDKRPVDLASYAQSSEQQVKNWCSGTSTNPSLNTSLKISEFTGISPESLFDEVDQDGNTIIPRMAANA